MILKSLSFIAEQRKQKYHYHSSLLVGKYVNKIGIYKYYQYGKTNKHNNEAKTYCNGCGGMNFPVGHKHSMFIF